MDTTPEATAADAFVARWAGITASELSTLQSFLPCVRCSASTRHTHAPVRFTARGALKKRLPGLLKMLVALGRASENAGLYSAV